MDTYRNTGKVEVWVGKKKELRNVDHVVRSTSRFSNPSLVVDEVVYPELRAGEEVAFAVDGQIYIFKKEGA